MARCNVCDKGYATKQGLRRHMETHTETQKHTCKICSAKFSYYHMHRVHMNHHNDENHTHVHSVQHPSRGNVVSTFTICQTSADLVCTICGKLFKCNKYLKEHMHLHTSPGKYQCSSCGKSYSHRGALLKHSSKHAK